MWVFIILLFVFTLMLACYMRCKKIWQAVLFGSGSGILSLGALGIFTTGLLHFNVFTILLSAIAGIPGVITSILLSKFIA